MRLVYMKDGSEVKVGDIVQHEGQPWRVAFFRPPHKPASSGKVSIAPVTRDPDSMFGTCEYYVGVIGAEWIEREDRV